MKSRVFDGPEVEIKLCFKKVPNRASEMASLITYRDFQIKEESQAKRPNNNSIRNQDMAQRETLTGLAKACSQKMIKPKVAFN